MCDWVSGRRRATIAMCVSRCLHADYETGASEVISEAILQLDEYFSGKRQVFTVPLLFTGTPFQRAVWKELTKIPYGDTISYGEVARRVGNPQAARAVGAANAVNPISIIVPCHRVTGSNHRLIGYGGGVDAKQMLLGLESAVSVGKRFEPIG